VTDTRRLPSRVILAVVGCAIALGAGAHLGPIPPSLKGIPVPPVPGLTDGLSPIVVDPAAAVVLGKALSGT